jgi:hypothetical protein
MSAAGSKYEHFLLSYFEELGKMVFENAGADNKFLRSTLLNNRVSSQRDN